MKKININEMFGGYLMPKDIVIESHVLSACLNGKASVVLDYISTDDVFSSNDSLSLFKAIKECYNKDGNITVLAILMSSKDNFIAGIAAKVKEVLFQERDIVPNCIRLIELYIARQTIKVCHDTVEIMYKNDAFALESAVKLVEVQKSLIDSVFKNKTETFNETKNRVIEEIATRVSNIEDSVISTGIYDIDNAIGGYEVGSVNVVAARPGMGKTAFTIQLIYNIGFIGNKPILAFNLEMTKEELVKRLLALHTQSGNFEMRSGFFGNQKRFEKFKEDAESFVTENIYLIDNIYDSGEICRLARNYKETKNIELCIIDYIQLVSAGGGNREQEVSKISRLLKMTAKANQIPIIALAQLNRSVETRGGDKRPILSDLRESGSIEQDADSVTMLYRPEVYGITQNESGESLVGIMELLVLKYRNGMPSISIPVNYEPKYNMITTINKKPTSVPNKPIVNNQSSIDIFDNETTINPSKEEYPF